MFIQVYPSGPASTNAYIVACSSTREAAIIDPAPNSAKKIIDYLSLHHLNPKRILLTHSHWDHIADILPLKEKYQIPVSVHSLDAPNLIQPGADGLPCWISIPGTQPDSYFDQEKNINVGLLSFSILHTPGHSPGCVCFYELKHGVIFSGDTLFKGAIGNLSFPTSQPSRIHSSLALLAQLPATTKVFPGHGPATTIQAETDLINSFVK